MFDALAKRYFDNPENYAEALELYERYYTACKKYKTFEEMEQRFFETTLDSAGNEPQLLEKAIRYITAKKLNYMARLVITKKEISCLRSIMNFWIKCGDTWLTTINPELIP